MDRLNLTLSALAVLALAWAASRMGQGGQQTDTPAPDDQWYVPPDPASIFDPWSEQDQTTTILEDAMITVTPSTYTPVHASAAQAEANTRAFLDLIAYSEGTAGRDGYRTIFGGQLFDNFADHPRVYVPYAGTTSSAAGRYQFLARTWDKLAARLGLSDFGPDNQDRAALELIRERGAINDVRSGRIALAVDKCKKVWASLPGAGYGQPERNLTNLLAAYTRAGGQLEQNA